MSDTPHIMEEVKEILFQVCDMYEISRDDAMNVWTGMESWVERKELTDPEDIAVQLIEYFETAVIPIMPAGKADLPTESFRRRIEREIGL